MTFCILGNPAKTVHWALHSPRSAVGVLESVGCIQFASQRYFWLACGTILVRTQAREFDCACIGSNRIDDGTHQSIILTFKCISTPANTIRGGTRTTRAAASTRQPHVRLCMQFQQHEQHGQQHSCRQQTGSFGGSSSSSRSKSAALKTCSAARNACVHACVSAREH